MSRVLTFSRQFPAHHVRKGEPTFFPELIVKGLGLSDQYISDQKFDWMNDFVMSLDEPKLQTIRSGSKWKAGDKARPCTWLLPGGRFTKGNKLIQFAPEIEIKRVYDFEITKNRFGVEEQWLIHVDYRSYFQGIENEQWDEALTNLAKNDGLTVEDFKSWFKWPTPFKGQIISWSSEIQY